MFAKRSVEVLFGQHHLIESVDDAVVRREVGLGASLALALSALAIALGTMLTGHLVFTGAWPSFVPGGGGDATLAAGKERAWRELGVIDEALLRGEIDDEGWHERVLGIVEPAYRKTLERSSRAAAINMPGSDLSQPASSTEPSRRSALITTSTESAITSRLTSE